MSGGGDCLSASTITRLTVQWQDEAKAFNSRDLSGVDYVYLWVDGIHLGVRLDDEKLCLLVMIGVRVDGTKELVALTDGFRESTGGLQPAQRTPRPGVPSTVAGWTRSRASTRSRSSRHVAGVGADGGDKLPRDLLLYAIGQRAGAPSLSRLQCQPGEVRLLRVLSTPGVLGRVEDTVRIDVA